MCTSPSWEPDHSSAVSVVPMPRRAGLAWTMSRSALSARRTAWSSALSSSPAGTWVSSGRSASMTAALAISPTAWPPIPSATASNRAPAYAASSLSSRCRPMSDRIP